MNRVAASMRGAVLVVSLIMLLLLTLLGFAAMNTSVLEVLMSFNTVRQTQSLATAENVLRIGESDLEDLVVTSSADATSYYYNHYDGGTDPLETELRDWSGFNTEVVEGAVAGSYLIEYIGPRDIPGCTAAWEEGATGCKVHAHLVSARSNEDGSRASLRMVQSVYTTLRGP
ncbi:pilus assembly PilX family protein [Pseudazoarcus pumilus]|uniref:Type 4 fimbrial biogenesis protein PilX N-terminal domain-containing protein n=1 Tax=Pseudazoarcus pumilus TaxID=2067960 RepID=A0A2I6S8A7_9RHOO|nr:PilX N-terminal domain-containing pilus assembly protein [Pseudazoarcus pumilus]AUN95493.1 hypothetical protein C0099_11485 [Pseudazoarcus pumilus]